MALLQNIAPGKISFDPTKIGTGATTSLGKLNTDVAGLAAPEAIKAATAAIPEQVKQDKIQAEKQAAFLKSLRNDDPQNNLLDDDYMDVRKFWGTTTVGTPEWDAKNQTYQKYLQARDQQQAALLAQFNASPEGRLKAAYGAWEDKLNNFKGTAAEKQNLITDHVRDQLLAQSKGYGFNWKANKDEIFHATNVANILTSQGVNDLSLLRYDSKGDLYKTWFSDTPGHGRYYSSSPENKINWYKNDDENRGQVGWSAAGTGRTNYMVKPDAAGNPVFYPDWKSNAPGGIGGFLLKAAPAIVGIATGNPWLAAATSAGIGAISGQNPGDILKGAALAGGTSYLGGAANAATQGALAGLDPDLVAALSGAAQGATASGISGIATGNFKLDDILKSALAGGAASGIKSLLTDKLPAGQQGPTQPSAITGIAAIDKVIPGAAGNLAGQVVAGRDLGDALTSTAIGAAGNIAAGQAGAALSGVTGIPEIDKFLAGAGAGLTGAALTTFLKDQLTSPTSPTRPATTTATTTAAAPNAVKPTTTATAATPATTTAATKPVTAAATTTTTANPVTTAAVNAPTTTAPTTATTAVNGNNNLLNYLSLAGMLGGGQSGGTTSAPVLANVKPMDLGWLTPTVNRLYPKKVA